MARGALDRFIKVGGHTAGCDVLVGVDVLSLSFVVSVLALTVSRAGSVCGNGSVGSEVAAQDVRLLFFPLAQVGRKALFATRI